ncbi:MAG: hypothetical protein GY805_31540 [Chloroflexi bacterium]|nr:hypothetical protein [Chloroflexota bacterium]
MRESERILGTPIVFERPKKKKKKGRKSKSLRDVHAMERHLSKAMHRTVRAADSGMMTYRKASKKSARKSRDGAIISFLPNVVEGGTAVVQEMVVIPLDLVRAGYSGQGRRLVRRSIRTAARSTNKLLRP